MTLEQLRVFVAVAERQHVTRAVEALHLAQSAVSASIAALEARHGAKLFHRVGRGIELTEAGACSWSRLARCWRAPRWRSWFCRSLAVSNAASSRFRRARRSWLLATAPSRRVPPRLSGGRVRLSMVNTREVAAAVRGGVAELGFVEGEVDDPVLAAQPVARDQLVIVIGAEHSWGEAKGLGKVDLLDVDWVLREPGSGTRSGFEHALGALSLSLHELRVALELPSNEAVRAAVEAGMGAAVMSASVAAPSIEAGLLRQVNFALPERCYYALRHAERCRSRAAETLMDVIRGSRPGLG